MLFITTFLTKDNNFWLVKNSGQHVLLAGYETEVRYHEQNTTNSTISQIIYLNNDTRVNNYYCNTRARYVVGTSLYDIFYKYYFSMKRGDFTKIFDSFFTPDAILAEDICPYGNSKCSHLHTKDEIIRLLCNPLQSEEDHINNSYKNNRYSGDKSATHKAVICECRSIRRYTTKEPRVSNHYNREGVHTRLLRRRRNRHLRMN